MKTKDILKQAIKDFDGTVIVVSHDREFLDGLVEKVYEFGGGKVRECLGGIYEFLEKKKLSSLRELELTQSPGNGNAEKSATKAPTAATAAEAPAVNPRKLSYAEQRERDKMLRKAAKKVEEAEANIAKLEAEIADIEQRISGGEATNEIFTLHQTTTKALENAMSDWELASMEHDELKASFEK
jgi:ATP-binding cassette subfamily F protein 3